MLTSVTDQPAETLSLTARKDYPKSLVLDVNSATYADVRDSLRAQNSSDMVRNKLIHLNQVVLRERQPVETTSNSRVGQLIFGSFLIAFVILLIRTVARVWR
jgi:hypothetical protein